MGGNGRLVTFCPHRRRRLDLPTKRVSERVEVRTGGLEVLAKHQEEVLRVLVLETLQELEDIGQFLGQAPDDENGIVRLLNELVETIPEFLEFATHQLILTTSR